MQDKIIKLTCDSRIELIPLMAKAVRAICAYKTMNEEFLYQVELCLDEAVSNVIIHAYQSEAGHEVEVWVILGEERMTIKIIDSGKKNTYTAPLELQYDPNDLNSLPESGYGCFLINKLMDEVLYREFSGKNELILYKYLGK